MPPKEVVDLSPQKCPNSCKSPDCKEKPWPLDTAKTPIIWVLGGPGSGKTTLCQLLANKYGFLHLSTGELLRADVKNKNKRAKLILNYMRRGELVPNNLVLDLLYEAMLKSHREANGFLIDGYPREKDQGIAFENTFAPCNLVIYLEASVETMRARLQSRTEAGSNRPDFSHKAVAMQLKTFKENQGLVLAQYQSKTRKVNAEKSIEEVFASVVEIFNPLFRPDFEEESPKKDSIKDIQRRTISKHKTPHSSQNVLSKPDIQ